MAPEDKQLLIKDLCARLPYGVKAQVLGWNEKKGEVEAPLEVYSISSDGYVYFENDVDYLPLEDFLLFLRPMSSMTEKEFVYFMGIRGMNLKSHEIQEMMSKNFSHPNSMAVVNRLGSYSHNIDWLNEKMFDYRCLIEKGLALEAPKGMYK